MKLYRAMVVDVDDPQRRGRCRVFVFGLHAFSGDTRRDDAYRSTYSGVVPLRYDVKQLLDLGDGGNDRNKTNDNDPADYFAAMPWAEEVAASNVQGGLHVHHRIGDLVWVVFEDDPDHNHPVLMGSWTSRRFGYGHASALLNPSTTSEAVFRAKIAAWEGDDSELTDEQDTTIDFVTARKRLGLTDDANNSVLLGAETLESGVDLASSHSRFRLRMASEMVELRTDSGAASTATFFTFSAGDFFVNSGQHAVIHASADVSTEATDFPLSAVYSTGMADFAGGYETAVGQYLDYQSSTGQPEVTDPTRKTRVQSSMAHVSPAILWLGVDNQRAFHLTSWWPMDPDNIAAKGADGTYAPDTFTNVSKTLATRVEGRDYVAIHSHGVAGADYASEYWKRTVVEGGFVGFYAHAPALHTRFVTDLLNIEHIWTTTDAQRHQACAEVFAGLRVTIGQFAMDEIEDPENTSPRKREAEVNPTDSGIDPPAYYVWQTHTGLFSPDFAVVGGLPSNPFFREASDGRFNEDNHTYAFSWDRAFRDSTSVEVWASNFVFVGTGPWSPQATYSDCPHVSARADLQEGDTMVASSKRLILQGDEEIQFYPGSFTATGNGVGGIPKWAQQIVLGSGVSGSVSGCALTIAVSAGDLDITGDEVWIHIADGPVIEHIGPSDTHVPFDMPYLQTVDIDKANNVLRFEQWVAHFDEMGHYTTPDSGYNVVVDVDLSELADAVLQWVQNGDPFQNDDPTTYNKRRARFQFPVSTLVDGDDADEVVVYNHGASVDGEQSERPDFLGNKIQFNVNDFTASTAGTARARKMTVSVKANTFIRDIRFNATTAKIEVTYDGVNWVDKITFADCT